MFPMFLGGGDNKKHHHHHKVDTKGIEKSIDSLGNKVEQAGLDISAGADTVCAAIYHSKTICMHCDKDLTSYEDRFTWIEQLHERKMPMLGLGSSYVTPCCKSLIFFQCSSIEEQFTSDQYRWPEPISTWASLLHLVVWYTIERATIRRSTGTCMHHQPKMSYATPEVLVCGEKVEGWV